LNLSSKFFVRWFPILVHIGCLVPIPVLVLNAYQGNLTADPIQGAILRTGKIALELLVLSLACTPLNTIFGFSPALRVRRALGDYAFLYVCIHFAIFMWLDFGFNLYFIGIELLRPYALIGLIAGILLIPLAITSFSPWPKKLGQNWKRLHSLVYLIDILAVVHYLLVVKSGVIDPYLWLIVIIFLLLLRLPPIRHFLSGFFVHQG
jgi:sulfoxide reductase heme-binding subunit YedZ